MTPRRTLAAALVVFAAAVCATPARADVLFSVLTPYEFGGTPLAALRLDLTTRQLSSADIDLSALASDPFFSSSALLNSEQITPVFPAPFDTATPTMFKMPALSATSFAFDPTALTIDATYGPGSFYLGLPTGETPVAGAFPFLQADFTNAVLSLDIRNGTGSFFGNATFSRLSFDASGLTNPGLFFFNLGDQRVIGDLAPALLEYTVDPGALAAPVPEPATLTLLGLGLAAAARRRHQLAKRR